MPVAPNKFLDRGTGSFESLQDNKEEVPATAVQCTSFRLTMILTGIHMVLFSLKRAL